MDILAGAAVLLSLERIFYIWLCRAPGRFAALCRVPWSNQPFDPVLGVQGLFYGFKALQFGVVIWCLAFGGRVWPPSAGPVALAIGTVLVAAGQLLNASVFRRLGRMGVFYGGQFGNPVPWHSGFPFSRLRHPQYVGAVASIWGALLILRYPAPDWIVLPLLETLYYWLSSRLEYYRDAESIREAAFASEN